MDIEVLRAQLRAKRSDGPFRVRESYTREEVLRVFGQRGHNPQMMIVYTTGINYLWMREEPYMWSYAPSELLAVARTIGVVGDVVARSLKEVINICSRRMGLRELDSYKGFYMAAFHLSKEQEESETIAPGLAIAAWKEGLQPYRWSKSDAWCNFYKDQHGSEPVTYEVWMGVHDYVVADTEQEKYFYEFEPPGPLQEGAVKTMMAAFEKKLLGLE